jgi:hypothetical protein
MNRDDRIEQLTNLATQMREKDKSIKRLQKELEQEQNIFEQLSSKDIPILMSELRMRSFTLDDGTYFSVVPVLKVTAPKDKMDDIDNWLSSNGHSGMVKKHLDVPLTTGISAGAINKIKVALHNLGYECIENKSIHYQTLNKWAREMEMEGMVIPEELFTIFRSNKTIID